MNRTILPLLVAFGLSFLTNTLLQAFYYVEPDPRSDMSTPGFVFLIEYLFYFFGFIFIVPFQHYFIVPKTKESIHRAIKIISIISLSLGILGGFTHFWVDGANLVPSILAGFVFPLHFSSFAFGDILTIGIINKYKNTLSNIK